MPVSCEPSSVMAASKCFMCLDEAEQAAIQTYLLCQIAGMICTPQTLMTAAKCYMCLGPAQLQAINTYLLCQILAGGGSGAADVDCGVVDPTVAPTTTCAIYYRTDNGAVWVWNGAAWLQIIAP